MERVSCWAECCEIDKRLSKRKINGGAVDTHSSDYSLALIENYIWMRTFVKGPV